MVNKIVELIVKSQISHHKIKKEDYSIFKYGYTIFLEQIINSILAILLGFYFKIPVQVITFLLFYILLRVYAGGYHAKTTEMCTLLSTVVILFICLIVKNNWIINNIVSYNYIILVVTCICILFLCPVEDINKPLKEEQKKRYHKKTMIMWGSQTIFYFVFEILGLQEFSQMVLLSYLLLSIALIIGEIKNRITRGARNQGMR